MTLLLNKLSTKSVCLAEHAGYKVLVWPAMNRRHKTIKGLDNQMALRQLLTNVRAVADIIRRTHVTFNYCSYSTMNERKPSQMELEAQWTAWWVSSNCCSEYRPLFSCIDDDSWRLFIESVRTFKHWSLKLADVCHGDILVWNKKKLSLFDLSNMQGLMLGL